MNASTQLLALGAEKRSERPIGRFARSILQRTSAWAVTCADYFAAASAYEQLSRLSDQELHRRGFSRATLARDVSAACDSSRQMPMAGMNLSRQPRD